jgi:hypothetical protein
MTVYTSDSDSEEKHSDSDSEEKHEEGTGVVVC